MTLLYLDERFLEHETGRHPERPERILQLIRHLERTGLDQRCRRPDWQPASLECLSRVHQPDYVRSVEQFVAAGGRKLEADTVVSPKSYDVARLAAGAVCDAVSRVLSGEDRRALCLVRPPGHHALADAAMGFCLFNNVAIGARLATSERDVDRVLIVDWDVHHGNGTQAAFWTDPRVAFLSIHRWPFYPGTGDRDETGSGPGLGTTVNLPIEFGTPRSDYLERFATSLERLADKVRPQLVLISAGFDAHRDDPIGSLELETEDFGALTRIVLDVADAHAEGRVVSVLEGGYNTSALAGSVELHLRELLAAENQARGEKGRS
jgi:acetoin utilization deacetylase AcuC-like enzyme